MIKAFVNSGLASLLVAKDYTVSELAQALNLREEGVQKVLKVLAFQGIVEEEQGRYRLKEAYRRFFDKNSPFYVGPYFKHAERLMENWIRLDDALKAPLKKEKPSGTFFADLARGLFSMNWQFAWILFGEMGHKKKVLDVGCGSCVWSIPFAVNRAEVVGLDFPEVMENAAKFCVKSMNVLHRYSFIEGDLFDVEWGSGYDLVIMAQILHSNSPEQVTGIFERAKRAVSSDGEVVVVEFVDGYGKFPAVFDINMFLNTKGGKVYSRKELDEIASNYGLSLKREIPIDLERGVLGLVFA
ncbi:SAM-dependent methyltransferase [Thermosulfidibacter takaii ABI70S6]|uniref:SAM-dependent methyltransferase n=1 Tax=Thermosulfidibacter takaii (strain DSM 17441 / JCM 13301 / NBRC 103674 / ABI70S6) TaxID=1298851 RepID=A0A0S3QVA5_THET7|nr:SAM-dependent methyltransferase [Thermosulfidibacter takaii ABI70S6]